MENVTGNTQVQENGTVETHAISLGKILCEARERLGLSVSDVASQIKFAPRQIEALEADDFQRLPETAFLRGFVRSYAKILQLDAETLLAALPQKKTAQGDLVPNPVGDPFPDVHSVMQQNMIWLGAALLLLIAVAGFAIWHFTAPAEQPKAEKVETPLSLPDDMQISHAQLFQETGKADPVVSKTPPAVTVAQSSVKATNPVATKPAQRKHTITTETQPGESSPIISLRLEFSEESWTEIKDKDDKIISSQVNPAGSELRVDGHAPLSILIGHAPAARLYLRDKEIDLAPHTRHSTGVASLTLE